MRSELSKNVTDHVSWASIQMHSTYNKDIKMFQSLATSLSRTVFCNVVICNTGFFGGSLVVSPFYEAHKRVLYSHEGGELFTTQIVELPVRDLLEAQDGKAKKEVQQFKNPPPGFNVGGIEGEQLKLFEERILLND